MKSNRTQVVLLLVFLYCTAVYGAGQMFLNQINPVKDDTVTFMNDVYSYDAAIENAETNTLQILKQYELNIQVPEISLTGKDGVNIIGTLGASLISQGDIAVGGAQFYGEGHAVFLNSLQEFDITSDEDTSFFSNLATTIIAGGVNVTTTGDQGINIASAGDVTISTKDEVNIAANQLSNTNTGDLTLNALRGELKFASGSTTTFSSGDRTHINGVLGVNFASSGSFSLTSQDAFFFGQAISYLAMEDASFTYTNTIVAAEEDIKVYGDSISIGSVASNVYFKASGMYSNILLTGDSGITINANSLVSLASQGEAGDVIVLSNEFSLSTQTLSSIIGGNLILGGNNTDNIRLAAVGSLAAFSLKGYYLDAHAADEININAGRDAVFNAEGNTFFQTTGGASTGVMSLTFQSTNSDLYLYSDIGDGSVVLQALDSSVLVDSDGDLDFETYNYISHFTGTQEYFLQGPLNFVTIDDTSFRAKTAADFTVSGELAITGYNLEWNATDTLSYSADGSVFFETEGARLTSNSSISFLSVGSQTFSSGNDINIENFNSTIEASVSIEYSVDTFSLTSGNSLIYAREELSIELFESFHAVVTDDFTLDSNNFNIEVENNFFKSSNIIFEGTDSALLDTGVFTGKFGYVLVDATGSAILDTDEFGDINVVSGGDISLASTGPLDINVGDSTVATAEEDFTINANAITSTVGESLTVQSNSGDQIIQTGDLLTIETVSDSFWDGRDISVEANENFLVNANSAINVNGGEIYFTSGFNNQHLSLSSSNNSVSINTETNANPDVNFSIAVNGRALNFTASNNYTATSGDTIAYISLSLDFDSSTIEATGEESLVYLGSSLIFNSTTNGTFNSDQEARFVSSSDDYINIDSAQDLTITSNFIDILSEGDTKFEAQNSISVDADGSIEFNSEFLVTVSADDSLTLLATDSSLSVGSAHSVNFNNANGFNTLIRSNEANVIFSPTRDFGIEANGVDELSECGVLLSASNRGSASHQHISDGTLDILAEHCVDIRSYYTDQTAESSGNINIASSGHVFLFSETEAVTLLSNGVNTATNNAINLEATSTVEIQATKSAVYIIGETGLSSDSGNNYDVHGLRGVTLKSNGTDANFSFTSAENTFAVGARGLSLAAGTDAPFFAGDFTASADGNIAVESGNNILFRSFAAVTGPDAIRLTATGDIDVASNEGAGVFLSAAQDVNVIGGTSVSIHGTDGLIRLDADIGDFTVDSVNSIAWTTSHGPIGIEGKGSGSSITFNALSFDSISYLSTRIDALGSGSIVAGSTLTLSSPDASACVQVQTFRDYDSVKVSAGDSFSLVTDANPQVYDVDHVIIAGNNVDIAATDSVSFIQSELFEIGRDSTPIVRVIAGGIGATGVAVSALGDIELNSGSTYSSSSTLDTTFNSQNINVTSQGVISLVAEGTVAGSTDLSVTSLNYFSIGADFIQESAPVSYSVTSDDFISIVSFGDDTGDRIEFDSLTFIDFTGTGDLNSYEYTFDISALEVGDFAVTTTNDVSIFNSQRVLYDLYNVEPLSPPETEQGQIEWIAGFDIILKAASAEFATVNGDVSIKSGFETKFTVATSTEIDSADAVILKAGNDLVINSKEISFTASGINQFYLFNELIPQDFLSGQVLWNSNDEIVGTITTDLSIAVAQDVIIDSFGSLTLKVTTDISIAVSDTTASNVLSFNSLSDISIVSDTAAFDWTANAVDYIIFDEVSKDFISGASTYLKTATIIADSVTKDVNFEAQEIVMRDDDGSLEFNAGGIYVGTLGAKSNILTTIDTDLVLAYTLADFLATDLNLVRTDGDFTINDIISEYHSHFGDVSFDYVNQASFVASSDLIFDAYGKNNARVSALELNSKVLSLDTKSIFWQGYQSTDFFAFGASTVAIEFGEVGSEMTSFDIQTTNYEGDILLNTFNGGFTITVDADFVSRSDEALFYGATSADITSEVISLSTVQDYSRITVRTLSEDSQTTINAGATIAINTDRYSEYLTSDKSDFAGQISISATTTLKMESNRATNIGLDDSMVFHAEFGIWLHSSAIGDSSVEFTTETLLHDADRVIFEGNSFALTTDDGYSTYIRAGNNINIQSLLFDLAAPVTDVTFETVGLENDNHIIVTGPSFSLKSTTLNLFATGSNSNIEFIADSAAPGTVSFEAVTSITNTAESGIRFLTTNPSDGSSSVTFTAQTSLSVHTYDWEDSILFQSDNDIVISGTRISQMSINHRLGFFSQEPDFINFVGIMGFETCSYHGYCGGDGDNPDERNLTGFNRINSAINALQNRMMDFGLIMYRNGLVLP